MPFLSRTCLPRRLLGPVARAADLAPDASLIAALPPEARPRATREHEAALAEPKRPRGAANRAGPGAS